MTVKKTPKPKPSQEKKPSQKRKASANAKKPSGTPKRPKPKLDADGNYVYHGHFNRKYDPDMCDRVPGLYENGESDVEVATALGVNKTNFYEWQKKYPEFKAAVIQGKQVSEAWWNNLGRHGAAGLTKVSPALWFGNMKNKFGWRDDVTLDIKANTSEIKELQATVARIKKHEKEA